MPHRLSKDESRAVAFIGLLLGLSAAVRLFDRPTAVPIDAPGVDLAALESASRQLLEHSSPPDLGPGERIDPNTASLTELMRLPGAGRQIAERIVAERATAPFQHVEDLDRVRGIGPASLERWRSFLTLPAATGANRDGAATARRAAPSTTTGSEPENRDAIVDLNRATAQELERLPGIGPALAARIIAWRDSAGGFRRVEELEHVRGIGPALLARLAPLVRTQN